MTYANHLRLLAIEYMRLSGEHPSTPEAFIQRITELERLFHKQLTSGLSDI
ncbi:hypothetical protein MOR33_004458 [Salmonella enterica]|nr:hypothetical protein [Salmonella enterica]EGL7478659.1 hypothetical protein [Salmonella enterica]EIZ2335444.1 hypothetical protein [Salmonella enterica]